MRGFNRRSTLTPATAERMAVAINPAENPAIWVEESAVFGVLLLPPMHWRSV